MPFIVGSPRSGTTLLRMMLSSSSLLAIPPETGFVAHLATHPNLEDLRADELLHLITHFPPAAPTWPDFGLDEATLGAALAELQPFSVADGIRCFYRLYAQRHGKRRVGDKTPLYGQAMDAIERLLPEAAFVHIIRDGRDCSLSLRELWFAPGRNIDALATYWRDNVATCRGLGRSVRHYIEVRFENLVVNTEAELSRICDFLDLPFEPAMLRHQDVAEHLLAEHQGRVLNDGAFVLTAERRRAQQWRTAVPADPSRIGVWRVELTPEEQAAFWKIAGSLLGELGYQA
ncbi:MAG TPA: sulfotransferase [Dongiaceae bacterium]|nr:sulfotransferase [Dongiaceae bacterium]